jgi:uncharacterized membrane protein (UPF0127 family)
MVGFKTAPLGAAAFKAAAAAQALVPSYFMRAIALMIVGLSAATVSCGSKETTGAALTTREVTLPSGAKIVCEVMVRPEDMARGMMYRDSLPADRGMLFIHDAPGKHSYWMHNVKIPLDIIWMDGQRSIVEISPATPPCTTDAERCPNYGGNVESVTVLELAGGSVQRHRLKVGDRLVF